MIAPCLASVLYAIYTILLYLVFIVSVIQIIFSLRIAFYVLLVFEEKDEKDGGGEEEEEEVARARDTENSVYRRSAGHRPKDTATREKKCRFYAMKTKYVISAKWLENS